MALIAAHLNAGVTLMANDSVAIGIQSSSSPTSGYPPPPPISPSLMSLVGGFCGRQHHYDVYLLEYFSTYLVSTSYTDELKQPTTETEAMIIT